MMRRIIIVAFVFAMIGTIFGVRMMNSSSPQQVYSANLPQFSLEQLKAFDGTDPGKPIYLAMDGLVYDVTPGKEFYQTGGVYHDLAGKDSSKDLHFFGGAIIKRKYKVIGSLKL